MILSATLESFAALGLIWAIVSSKIAACPPNKESKCPMSKWIDKVAGQCPEDVQNGGERAAIALDRIFCGVYVIVTVLIHIVLSLA